MENLGKAADLADNLIEIDLYKAEYPSWIKAPKLKGYTFEKLKAKILEFAEVHQNACAEYGPCGNLMAGYWLQNLIDKVADANAGKGPQVIGYASVSYLQPVNINVKPLFPVKKLYKFQIPAHRNHSFRHEIDGIREG